LKHVSHYVLAGAQRLPLSGTFTNMLAFKNVDNSYVIVIQNDQKEKISPVIKIGDRLISATLEPDSFNTIVLK
jgi:glucosylceramidase